MPKQQKIPTLLGILLVMGLLFGIGFIMEQLSRGRTRASTSIEPKQVIVTNVTDTSFTFVWQTDDVTSGSLLVSGPTGKKSTAFDERDMTGKTSKYLTHSVTVRALSPETPYDVTIISNGKRYPVDNKLYQVTTMPMLSSQAPGIEPAYGLVVLPGGKPGEGAIVTITLDGGQILSTLVRSSGSWVIPLSLVRMQDGGAYLPNEERINETITIDLGGAESRIITDTLNDSPVPDITIGQSYDFRGKDAKKIAVPSPIAVKPPSQQKTENSAVLGMTTSTKVNGVAFTAPAEGAVIKSSKPLISGIGIAGKTVTVTVGIDNPYVGTTMVKKDGTWQYTPTRALAPGKQSVTITTIDNKNKHVALTHTFTILKSGSQVLGDATPSATPTSSVLTPTPTLESDATPTPTLESTDSAEAVAEPMPQSGSFFPTLLLIILGTFLCIGGGTLLFIRNP
jgi:hypothetical protein